MSVSEPAAAPATVTVRPVEVRDLDPVIGLDAAVTGLAKPDYWYELFHRYGARGRQQRFFLVAEAAGEIEGADVGADGRGSSGPGDEDCVRLGEDKASADRMVCWISGDSGPTCVGETSSWLAGAYDLGGEFFRWEFATAVAGHLLGVNPFDQPDVESAKKGTRAALAAYRERGALPSVDREVALETAAAEIRRLLAASRRGGYVALQAFVDPRRAGAPLLELAQAVRERSGLAVTAGFGPRFLLSTGQLHKGGAPGGSFIQFVSDNPDDLAIPDDFGSAAGAIGFGVLKAAQSVGDLEALAAAGRSVLRVRLGNEGPGVAAALRALARDVRALP